MEYNINEKQVFDKLLKEKIGSEENLNCKFCQDFCRKNLETLSGPVAPFHVGSNFGNDPYSVAFVGKNSWIGRWHVEHARYEKGKGKFGVFTDFGRDSLEGNPEGQNSPFWKYTRKIGEELYGNLANTLSNIAITNVVKCNTNEEDGNTEDNTPEPVIHSCFKSKVFEYEMQVLKPKHIVFYTARKSKDKYLDLICQCMFGYKSVEIVESTTVQIGKNKLPWYTFNYYDENNNLGCSVLVTGHPERKKKVEFVNTIVDWIKKDKSQSNKLLGQTNLIQYV